MTGSYLERAGADGNGFVAMVKLYAEPSLFYGMTAD